MCTRSRFRRRSRAHRPGQSRGARAQAAAAGSRRVERARLPDRSRSGSRQRRSHAHGAVSGHGAGGPAPKRIVVGYGFWIFLLSDVIMFSSFFAAYAVLFKNTAGGPAAQRAVRSAQYGACETGCLLASSFTCGMASLAVGQRSQKWTQMALLATGLLGVRLPVARGPRIRGLGRPRRGPRAAAPSCLRSSPWWAATACT